MKKYTFDDIRNNGWLLYEYVRGSVAYGTNTPESDEDHGGVAAVLWLSMKSMAYC